MFLAYSFPYKYNRLCVKSIWHYNFTKLSVKEISSHSFTSASLDSKSFSSRSLYTPYPGTNSRLSCPFTAIWTGSYLNLFIHPIAKHDSIAAKVGSAEINPYAFGGKHIIDHFDVSNHVLDLVVVVNSYQAVPLLNVGPVELAKFTPGHGKVMRVVF